MNVWDFIPNMAVALKEHLIEDKKRWEEKGEGGGDTWLKRTRKGQEDRVWENYQTKFADYFADGVPIDWLSIIGNALICWIRENHPEIWPE